MGKKKFTGIKEVQELDSLPKPCGVSRDKNGLFIGKYVYLRGEQDQPLLENLLQAFLDTYKHDNNFYLSLDLETSSLDYINNQILLYSISWNGRAAVVWSPYFLWGKTDSTGTGKSWELFLEVLRTIPINNQVTKFDGKFLLSKTGVPIDIKFCTMTAAQLGWPGAFPGNRFTLDVIVKNLLKPLDISKQMQTSFIGQPVEQEFTDDQVAYAASDTMITHRLLPPIKLRLLNEGLLGIWENLERASINSLLISEFRGIKVDKDKIEKIYQEKLTEVLDLEQKLQEQYLLIDESIRPDVPKGIFNPNSPTQILEVLGAKGMKLKGTGLEILEEARVSHTDLILDYLIEHKSIYTKFIKTLRKLLEEFINPGTDSIHPNYATCGAYKTGRLSCVHKDTQILTDYGYVKITNIQPNFTKVKTRTSKYQLITDLIYKGKEEMFEVTFPDGESIKCTEQHKFLNEKSDWISLKQILSNRFQTRNGKWHSSGSNPILYKYLDNENCFTFTGIKSIKSIGIQDVWDITVAEDASYVSKGGFVNHNSSDPNTQNITPDLRPVFIARKDHKLITSDFGQFEFRACAGITQEQFLIDVFHKRAEVFEQCKEIGRKYNVPDPDQLVKALKKGKLENVTVGETEFLTYFGTLDIHKMNASLIFGGDVKDVSDQNRTIAKTLGYALLYGSGAGTILSQLMGEGITNFSIKDISGFTETFFKQLPKVKTFIDEVHKNVIKPGYIQNTLGRRRYFSLCPKYMSQRYEKELADARREAVNWHFQSRNADALKLAIPRMDSAFESHFGFKMQDEKYYQPNNEYDKIFLDIAGDIPVCLLNVHDEVVVEAHDDIVNECADIVVKTMVECGSISIGNSCPIESSVLISNSWAK